MQQPAGTSRHALATGQCYRISSFDLGFINVIPVDLLVEIKGIDRDKNEVMLAVHPASVTQIAETFLNISRWFEEVYPRRTAADCLLKNLGAFGRLIDRGSTVLLQ